MQRRALLQRDFSGSISADERRVQSEVPAQLGYALVALRVDQADGVPAFAASAMKYIMAVFEESVLIVLENGVLKF